MYIHPWYHWITFLYIYCFFGRILESTYVPLKSRRLVNRGFLRLPMLPLYRTGVVMMLWFSLPVKDSLFLVYLAGVIAATLLEHTTGHVMERLFKMKYWDYSNQPLNLHSYICFSSPIAWGFLITLLTDVIHKPIADMVLDLNPIVEFTFIGTVNVLFVSDSVKSTKETLDLGRALEVTTRMKNELEEMQVQLVLLKAETTRWVTELQDDVASRVDVSLGDTAQQAGSSLEDITDSLEGTAQKIFDFPSDAVSRIADMKEETAQRMADMKEETYQRIADMREETMFHVVEAAQEFRERSEWEDALSDRIKPLTENRQRLSHQMSFYRKSLLRGNPSSSSSKFAEALKEPKEPVNNLKK